MRGRKLLWQLSSSYLLITLCSILALAWYSSRSLRSFYLEQTEEKLGVRARLLEYQVLEGLLAADSSGLNSLCRTYGKSSSTRISVILPSGRVVGDSDEDPSKMDSHADRPEVIEALSGRTGKSIRFSHTLQMEMMYLAQPVMSEGRVVGVLRTSMPLTVIDLALDQAYLKIALGGAAAVLLMVMVHLWIFHRISLPLERLREGAERFAQGDLEHKLPVFKTVEIGALAEALNRMATRLDDRIRAVERQRNRLQALLSEMTEGVLVTDREERIISMNRAAGHLFGVDHEQARGRSVQEAIRNSDLQRFIQSTWAAGLPQESEIMVVLSGNQRFLQAHGSLLSEAAQRGTGLLVVLSDVTRLRQLENIRREFVANVSHELKTPITSIKGFVETLLDGAMGDPGSSERFLQIISRQADRLGSIIEDILTLSRIEQEEEKKEIELAPGRIGEILTGAVQSCKPGAEAKSIEIGLSCEEDMRARVNPQLLELAVKNLIDNAIKYSETGSPVSVAASVEAGEVVISVTDQGCGIEKKHLSRIFERFYRADKVRSRKLGGTGLGLAIVKHIAQVHEGRVEVESTPGLGSVFSIHLPGADLSAQAQADNPA